MIFADLCDEGRYLLWLMPTIQIVFQSSMVTNITPPTCRIPDDCIDPRRYPLLTAREAMRQLVNDLLGRSVHVPGAL